MMGLLRDFARDDSGGAIVEYILVCALVSVVSLAALYGIGDALSEYFVNSSSSLSGVAETNAQ